MTVTSRTMLLIAHPGHELLLYAWLKEARPVVCVLTDGSGGASTSRLDHTASLLQSIGATRGPVFGRFTDLEVYDLLLSATSPPFVAVAAELTQFVVDHRITRLVTDSQEGFSPVHDLCRTIAGSVTAAAALGPHEEYPIYAGPRAYEHLQNTIHHDLDDATFRTKLEAARALVEVIPDIGDMFHRHGESSFRRESLRKIADWRERAWPAQERPLYETIGEQRVAEGRYHRVIRYHEHVEPIVRALVSFSEPVPCES